MATHSESDKFKQILVCFSVTIVGSDVLQRKFLIFLIVLPPQLKFKRPIKMSNANIKTLVVNRTHFFPILTGTTVCVRVLDNPNLVCWSCFRLKPMTQMFLKRLINSEVAKVTQNQSSHYFY